MVCLQVAVQTPGYGVRPNGALQVERPGLVIGFRDTEVFRQVLTGRINLPAALLRGQLKLRGDLRLFLRFGSLFSVDARK